mmetsp:Transcript_18614/g.23973  ORF Transcript_18614/g.23973 Transcript_18614/m.23973 type:complete len:155 (+) Transcript_18614:1-465(+)
MDLDNDGKLSLKDIVQLVECTKKDEQKAGRKIVGHVQLQSRSSGISPEEYLIERCSKVLKTPLPDGFLEVVITPTQYRDIILGLGVQMSAMELELCLHKITNDEGYVMMERFFSLAMARSLASPEPGDNSADQVADTAKEVADDGIKNIITKKG